MKLNPQELEKIASLTLDHCNERADDFWQGTHNHDVKQNIAALLKWIEGNPPFTILDFGCGPGRDLAVFSELGHISVGLEGAAHFAEMARAHSGCKVGARAQDKVPRGQKIAFDLCEAEALQINRRDTPGDEQC